MIKKSVLVVALLLIATNLWAAKTLDVSGTRHNLSSTSVNIPGGNIYMASTEDEVCIFCHTPHGGNANYPLWNRALPTTGAFTHYTSATISSSAFVGGVNRAVSPESLLCMSCHDGAVSMNSIINNSNRTVGAVPDNNAIIQPMFFTTGGAIGDIKNPAGFGFLDETRNLSDDHPISFSYSLAYNDITNSGMLHPMADVKTAGLRFFGPETNTADGFRVECSSCHDPHVNYEPLNGGDATFTPFLVRNNTGSALCLACHIK